MRRFLFSFFALLLAACGSDGGGTGAQCPTTDPPTYEGFAKAFFDTHCVGCHSSTRTGAQRGGAPVGRDYDTLAGVRADLDGIDGVAASGPDGTFTSMPPGAAKPSVEDRTRLGQFLACESAK